MSRLHRDHVKKWKVLQGCIQALETRTLLSAATPESLAQAGFVPLMWHGQQAYVEPGEWIVKFDGLQGESKGQLNAINALLTKTPLNLQASKYLGEAGLFLVKTPASAAYDHLLNALSHVAGFKYAEPNFAAWSDDVGAEVVAPENDPLYSEGKLWGLEKINAPGAWGIADGQNVVVAVIDTGVQLNHPDLAGNIWVNKGETPGNGIDDDGNGYVDDVNGWDFVNDDNNPTDDDGHGTHVSGTIAAMDNDIGVIGVAPQATIMPLKFLDASGYGLYSDAILAVNYCTTMKGMKVNVAVSNNSWSGTFYSQALYDAMKANGAAGILIAAAAGNGNAAGKAINTDKSPAYPASFDLDNILSVAATNRDDTKAYFSNYGLTSVDLGAPGVDITSTLNNGDYVDGWSGTSMATPHVSGVAALAYSKLGLGASYSRVKQAILAGTDPVSSLAGKTVTGGRLNAFNTLLNLATPTAPAAPTGLTAAVQKSGKGIKVVLSWTDNSNNEKGFVVERLTSPSTEWVPIGTVASNTKQYTDSKVTKGVTYSYRVYAFNDTGNSGYSNVAGIAASSNAPAVFSTTPIVSMTSTATPDIQRLDLAMDDNILA